MQDYFTDKGKTDILRSTRTGLWEIILRQGREPVMHADSVMLELLGLDAAPAPEECYQVWYNRIQDEYKGAVQETVSKAIASTRAEVQEVQYKWNHPLWGAYIRAVRRHEGSGMGGWNPPAGIPPEHHGYHHVPEGI